MTCKKAHRKESGFELRPRDEMTIRAISIKYKEKGFSIREMRNMGKLHHGLVQNCVPSFIIFQVKNKSTWSTDSSQ